MAALGPALRRTAVAEFRLADAHSIEAVEAAAASGEAASILFHLRRVLPEIPCVTASDEQVGRIRTGQSVNLPELSRARLVKVFLGQSDLVCIASRVAGTLFHPKVVLIEGN